MGNRVELGRGQGVPGHMAERLFEDCSAFAEVGATVIDWDEFERVEMRVGRILAVDDFSEARKPSYLLTIDFGLDLGVRRSSVAIRDLYRKEELVGRLVVAVTNFPPKQIANHMSQALVLAAVNRDGTMRLLQPDAEVELGARIR